MIGMLRGKILGKQPPRLLLDVQGVGYAVDAPMTTFYTLPEVGAEVTLFTHLAVREDAHTLYGFTALTDRDLFRSLLKVNGVGARLALGILSGMDARTFIACVQAGDSAALVRLPGIGKKTAERLIVELRDRLDAAAMPAATVRTGAAVPPLASSPVEEAVSALVGLGYKPQEASRMVRVIDATDLSCEDIIRSALQTTLQ
jgi:Holliday junction DNA helicase RuvA